MKTILTILLFSTLLFGCKKNSPEPSQSPEPVEQTDSTITTPTPTVIVTPTVPVSTNTLTLKVYVKTISGQYTQTFVPVYTGSYKVGLSYKVNGVTGTYIPNPVLNDPGNPRTVVLTGLKSGDVVVIRVQMIQSGATNHNGLPSFVVDFTQNNGNNTPATIVYQDKDEYLTYTML